MTDEAENDLQFQSSKFAVFAERKQRGLPLVMYGINFGQLLDEIVLPYEEDRPFFIDGVPIKKNDLDRIKIVRLSEHGYAFRDLHYGMRRGERSLQKVYGEQYHVRLEAAIREEGSDVTAQVLQAYIIEIKPKLSEYLPNKAELLKAAFGTFVVGLKALGSI